MPRVYFVYILASVSGTLYVGYTNDLLKRRAQHSIGSPGAFTARYKVDRLVYFETYTDIRKAQFREKRINWRREKKVALIRSMNPSWRDLSKDLTRHRRTEISTAEKQPLSRENRDEGTSPFLSGANDLRHHRRDVQALERSFERFQFNVGKRTWNRAKLYDRS